MDVDLASALNNAARDLKLEEFGVSGESIPHTVVAPGRRLYDPAHVLQIATALRIQESVKSLQVSLNESSEKADTLAKRVFWLTIIGTIIAVLALGWSMWIYWHPKP